MKRIHNFYLSDYVLTEVESPSGGYHIVTNTFDTRLLKEFTEDDRLTILPDGYIYCYTLTVD